MNHTALFEEQVALTPKDMCVEIESIDTLLAEKLQAKLEGKCSHHGYVVTGSLKVLSRSMGSMERGRFTGSLLFYIQAEANVLNPSEGSQLEGIVIRKNKMGMYVSYSVNDGGNEAIRVIVPRDLHIGDAAFEAVEIGETVKVQIKKSRFQVNDPYILSVGMFISSSGKGAKVTPVEVNTNNVEEVEEYGDGEAVEEYGEGEAVEEYGEEEYGEAVEEAGEAETKEYGGELYGEEALYA
jgi:DNA-directed RNA polymerase subunit E'/Rpb7